MTVSQLVSLFENIESPEQRHHHKGNSSSKVRLSLHSMFSSSRRHSARSVTTQTSPRPRAFSPASPYRTMRSPRTPTGEFPNPMTLMSLSSSPSSSIRSTARRQPSAIDVALEEESRAQGVEMVGLGFFEPRPRAVTPPASVSGPCSLMEFMHESKPAPVVLDGIFEVMESA